MNKPEESGSTTVVASRVRRRILRQVKWKGTDPGGAIRRQAVNVAVVLPARAGGAGPRPSCQAAFFGRSRYRLSESCVAGSLALPIRSPDRVQGNVEYLPLAQVREHPDKPVLRKGTSTDPRQTRPVS
jgi:hypothetical protein